MNGYTHSSFVSHSLSIMASFLKDGRLALALIIFIVITSSSHIMTIAIAARTPYHHIRQLATDCNSPIQQDIPECGSGGGSGVPVPPKRQPCGSTPGSRLCKKGCCGRNKMGDAICC